MNDQYNRIAGCRVNMEAAAKRVDCLASVVAQRMVEMEDDGNITPEVVAGILADYRKANDVLAEALDQLVDALRR
jgi:hypothetical protein